MTFMYEITEEHYRQAEQNGIPRRTVYMRVYSGFYDIERAISEPVGAYTKNRKYSKELHALREASGVSLHAFKKRKQAGWDDRKAATHPVRAKKPNGALQNA